jgi:hypothetical protein
MWDRQREATEAEERLRKARETDEMGVIVRHRTEPGGEKSAISSETQEGGNQRGFTVAQ